MQRYTKYLFALKINVCGNSPTRKEKYNNYSAQGLNDTFRNLADMGAGATTDWLMDYIGVLPGMAGLDNWYDKQTQSKTGMMQGARKMLSVVVPAILSGGKVKQQLGNIENA